MLAVAPAMINLRSNLLHLLTRRVHHLFDLIVNGV
jgi:hypothetical protein